MKVNIFYSCTLAHHQMYGHSPMVFRRDKKAKDFSRKSRHTETLEFYYTLLLEYFLFTQLLSTKL